MRALCSIGQQWNALCTILCSAAIILWSTYQRPHTLEGWGLSNRFSPLGTFPWRSLLTFLPSLSSCVPTDHTCICTEHYSDQLSYLAVPILNKYSILKHFTRVSLYTWARSISTAKQISFSRRSLLKIGWCLIIELKPLGSSCIAISHKSWTPTAVKDSWDKLSLIIWQAVKRDTLLATLTYMTQHIYRQVILYASD